MRRKQNSLLPFLLPQRSRVRLFGPLRFEAPLFWPSAFWKCGFLVPSVSGVCFFGPQRFGAALARATSRLCFFDTRQFKSQEFGFQILFSANSKTWLSGALFRAPNFNLGAPCWRALCIMRNKCIIKVKKMKVSHVNGFYA